MLFQSEYVEAKSFRRGLSLVSALFLGLSIPSGNAHAASTSNTANATASATATVVQSISITTPFGTPVLNFGTLVPTGTDGTVVIDAATGNRTTTDVDTIGAGTSSAGFFVNGEVGAGFIISFTPSFSISNGSNSMVVNPFTSFSVPPGAVPNTAVIPASGPVLISVGATLHVGASQPAGNYSDTFNVTVTYQ